MRAGEEILGEAAGGKALFRLGWSPSKGAGVLIVDTLNDVGIMMNPKSLAEKARDAAASFTMAMDASAKDIAGSGYSVGHVTKPRDEGDTTVSATPRKTVGIYMGGAFAFSGAKLEDADRKDVEKIVGGHMADRGWKFTKKAKL